MLSQIQTDITSRDSLIKIMSMNINGQASWYPDEPEKQWRNRAPVVREIIDQRRPDIVCWQEFGVTSRDDALQSASHRLDFYMGEVAGDIYINPISWNPERYQALDQQTFWLSETGEFAKAWDGAERGCSMVRLEDKSTKRQFAVYNLHLDNKSRLARTEGIGVVLRHIQTYAEKLPIIIAGDFNTSSWSVPGKEEYFDPTPLRLLEALDFIDSTDEVMPESLTPDPTFHGYRGEKIREEYDFYGLWDPDHIYIRGFEVVSTAVINEASSSRFPSDHYPVEAVLGLN